MIRIPQVRVVDEEGAQLGVMPTPQALEMAQERGLDLVEVAPMASPPVVKFLDFGQYKYELTKREKEAKRKQRSVTFKEVRLSPKIGIGDFDTKVHRAIEFLEDGDRIKVTVRFRGRELTHPELGRNLIARFADRVKDHGVAGADAAARRQVDAHHDGIDPQAQEPRGSDRPADGDGAGQRRGDAAGSDGRTGSDRHRQPAPEPAASRRNRQPAAPKPASRPRRPTAAAATPAPERRTGQGTGAEQPRTATAAATEPKATSDKTPAPAPVANRRVRPACRRSRATRRPRSASA